MNGLSALLPLRKTIHLRAANGSHVPLDGRAFLFVHTNNRIIRIDALVSSHISEDLFLSWHDLRELHVIPRDFPLSSTAFLSMIDTSEKGSSPPVLDAAMDNIKQQFSDVLGDKLDTDSHGMKCPPMHIHFREDMHIKPLNVKVARAIPHHLQDLASSAIADLIASKRIAKVSLPTDWCSPAHFILKPGGLKVRLVTDYRVLNNAVRRPVHPFPSASDLMKRIEPSSLFFCKLDAIHGYYQVPLDEESSFHTTFLLPSGRYRYLCAPMGLNSAGDEFCRWTDQAFEGIPYLLKIVDDMLIQASSIEMLVERVVEILLRCRKSGIKLSLSKMEWGSSIKFAGFLVSSDGVKADPDKVSAIRDFPTPTNITEVRSFLGLAQQLGLFAPDLAQLTVNIRALLKKGTSFQWLDAHDHEFTQTKNALCSDVVVKPFNPHFRTELLTDASRLFGIGYALVQRDDNDKLRLIHCSSRSLTPAQRNYAAIELECMAIVWAVQKCDYYLKGISEFTVITDHRPLLGIFVKPLNDLHNARLLRFREKISDYPLKIKWCPGKDHLVADALSRAPVFPCSDDPDLDTVYISRTVCQDPLFQSIINSAHVDKNYQLLLRCLSEDTPFPQEIISFQCVRHLLSVFHENDTRLVLYDSSRVVIPVNIRASILSSLHTAHCGEVKTYKNAKQLYFWPGMKNDIANIIRACRPCQSLRPSQQNLPLKPISAIYPMQQVSVDLFDFAGNDWLVMVDRYSGFPFVQKLTSLTSESIFKICLRWFHDWGFPQTLRSDNGPQFKQRFSTLCEEHFITHETSSPYNPASNGLAEAAVKNIKFLLKKCNLTREDFSLALLHWRNVPRSDGISPAQAFLGRRQRTFLPDFGSHVSESESIFSPDFRSHDRQQSKLVFDRQSKDLSTLDIGDSVLCQNPVSKLWSDEGIIISMDSNKRSYIVDIHGKLYRRNRIFLKPMSFSPPSHPLPADSTPSPPTSPAPRRSARLAGPKSSSSTFSPL